MEKLQKAGLWIWQNKEPLVLAIIVLVLCYRLYGVLNPKEIDFDELMAPQASRERDVDDEGDASRGQGASMRQARAAIYRRPGKEPDAVECKEFTPPPVPAMPPPPEMLSANQFAKENIFTARKDSTGPETGIPTPQMTLLDIKEWPDGSYRAQIRTRAKKWYEENEKFESYELQIIDPDAGSITVFSEQHGKAFTFTLEGAG